MVFDPTFNAITDEAEQLPDLTADVADEEAAEIDEGILDGENAADLPDSGAE